MGIDKKMTSEAIAYTITAGYYPEIASRLNFKQAAQGKGGAVGAKYLKVRGFSSSSLRRVKREAQQIKEMGLDPDTRGTGQQKDIVPEAFWRTIKGGTRRKGKALLYKTDADGVPTDELYSTRFGKNLAGRGLPEKITKDRDREKGISYTKWMGGGEMYKLYGSKVWYNEGMRNRTTLSETLINWGKALDEGNTGELPKNFLNSIYSDKEDKLIKFATTMANQLFKQSFEKATLQKELKSIGAGAADVAEEDVVEAQEELPKGWARQSKDGNIKIDKRSGAQKIDILTKFDGRTNLYLDSTEVAITQDGQHGVTLADEEIAKAINKLDVDDKGNPDGAQVERLRMMVQEFFIHNINKEYNPAIIKLKDFAAQHLDNVEAENVNTFKQILDAVESQRKELKKIMKEADARKGKKGLKAATREYMAAGPVAKKTISVANIASAAGMKLAAGSAETLGKKATATQAMKYTIHMLANLADGKKRLFAQGHRIATLPDNTKMYATVPMGLSPATMLFETAGKKISPEGTKILRGASQLLALAAAKGKIKDKKAQEVANRQIQARGRRLILNSTENNASKKAVLAASNAKKAKIQPTTVVAFHPSGLEKKFEQIMGYFQKNKKGGGSWRHIGKEGTIQAKWASKVQKKLQEFTYAWPTKKIKRGQKQSFRRTSLQDGDKFWALPYIGINDNVYRGKGHQQK